MDWNDLGRHARTTGSALKNWFIAQCLDSLAVAALWLVGLWIIHISDHYRFFYVLMLFAVIMVADGLFLQPYLMKRTAKVPFWASLLTPIVLGIIIPFWGVLLAPPLLAIVFAFRNRRTLDPEA